MKHKKKKFLFWEFTSSSYEIIKVEEKYYVKIMELFDIYYEKAGSDVVEEANLWRYIKEIYPQVNEGRGWELDVKYPIVITEIGENEYRIVGDRQRRDNKPPAPNKIIIEQQSNYFPSCYDY